MASLEQIEDLVRRAQHGDEAAIGQIVVATESLVVGTLEKMGFQRADAEDAAADVYLTLWKMVRRLRNPRGLITWLETTAYRFGLKKLRKLRREQARLREFAHSCPTSLGQDSAGDASIALDEILTGLSVQGRRVLTMKYVEGLTIDEIASRNRLSFAQVDYLLGRAREVTRCHMRNLGLHRVSS